MQALKMTVYAETDSQAQGAYATADTRLYLAVTAPVEQIAGKQTACCGAAACTGVG